MLPVSELNRLRREAVAELERQRDPAPALDDRDEQSRPPRSRQSPAIRNRAAAVRTRS